MSGQTLTLALDPAWLADPARTFPVQLDPTLTITGAAQDCPINANHPTTTLCGTSTLDVGVAAGGGGPLRSLLQFDLSAFPANLTILDAQLSLYLQSNSTSSTTTLALQPLTHTWTTGADWNAYDGANAWATPGGDYAASPSATASGVGGATNAWVGWAATALVQGWVNGSVANDGLLVKEATENVATTLAFCPTAPLGGCTAAEEPTLQISYVPLLGAQPFYALRGFGLDDRMGLAVNLADGNLLVQNHDLQIAGTGLDLTFDRFYNQGLGATTALGTNWTGGPQGGAGLGVFADGGAYLVGPSGDFVPFLSNGAGGFISPPGLEATLVKNGDGTSTLTWHANGERWQFDASGNMTAAVDRDGNTISLAYSGATLTSVTDTQGRQITLGYTGSQLTQVKDVTGNRLYQYGYTGAQLTTYTDPNNGVTRYHYNASGELDQLTDPDGNLTTIGYWPSGAVETLTLGAGSPVAGTYTFTYNAGNTVVTDPNQHQTTEYIDTAGRLTKAVDALGNTFGWGWNADDQVTTATDAKNQTTTYTYERASGTPLCSTAVGTNTLCSVQIPTGATTQYGYTDASHPYSPTSMTDSRGYQTTYSYNANGDLGTISTPAMVNSQSTISTIMETIHHNPNGTIATVDDFNGNITHYYYDAAGNLTSITPPQYSGSTQLGPTTIVPDPLSRPYKVTDGNNHTTVYSYDPLDRVTQEQFADGLITYVPDADGNVKSMTDSSGQTSYGYDARNRQTSKTLPASLGGGSFSYGYDPASNLTSYQDAGGQVVYHYNAGDELDSLLDPTSAKTTFGYDANRNRTTTSYPNGVTMAMGFDPSQRISSVTATKGTTTLESLSYSYTDNTSGDLGYGKDTPLLYQVQEQDAPGVGPSPTRNYTTTNAYDPRGLLLTWNVHNNANNTTVHDYEYQFDAAGNRTQIVADATVSPPPPNPKTVLAYNPANELITTTLYNQSGGQTAQATWTWDPGGELIKNSGYPGISGALSVGYSQHGQTTTVTDAYGNTVPMAYTGPGQAERTSAGWSTEPSPPTGKPAEFGSTSYSYSALGLMSRSDSTGTTRYTYDPSGLPISERTPSGDTYFFIFDGQGNVVMLVDLTNGAPVAMVSPCPTGNEPGDQWQQPGTNALDELILQYGGAFGIVYDAGTGNLKLIGGYSGASGTGGTQISPCIFGFFSFFCVQPAQPPQQQPTPEPIPCDLSELPTLTSVGMGAGLAYHAEADCAPGETATTLSISYLFFTGRTYNETTFRGVVADSCRNCSELVLDSGEEPFESYPLEDNWARAIVEFAATGQGYLTRNYFLTLGPIYIGAEDQPFLK